MNGDIEEYDPNQYMDEEEIGDDDPNQSHWDEKEHQKRLEIAKRFDDIGLQNDLLNLNHILENAKREEKAFEYRIVLNEEEHEMFIRTLTDINKHLAMTQVMLDAYIQFTNSTPKFDNFLNVLFEFHQFITNEEQRIFHQVNAEDGEYFYIAKHFDKYAKNLIFLLNRLIGTMEVAKWYIIDSEVTAQEIHGQDGGMGAGGMGAGGMGNYPSPAPPPRDLALPQARGYDGNVSYTKMNVKKRDIGDGLDNE